MVGRWDGGMGGPGYDMTHNTIDNIILHIITCKNK